MHDDYVPGVRRVSPATTPRPIHSRARLGGGPRDKIGPPRVLSIARTSQRDSVEDHLDVGGLGGDPDDEERTRPSVIVPRRSWLSGEDIKVSDMFIGSARTINT